MTDAATADKPHALSHLAFFYPPRQGELAAAFFEALGCAVQDLGPLNQDGSVYKILMDPAVQNVQYCYISPAQPEQTAFEKRLRAFLEAETDPSFAIFREFKLREPEMCFHAALKYSRLEDLETAILNVEALIRSTPELKERISILRFRPRSQADQDVNSRIERSPVFRMDDRPSFGEYNVQVFFHTDLFAGELLTLGQTLEIGYTFPRESAMVFAESKGHAETSPA